MRDPFLHWLHGDSINLIPKLYFFVVKMLIIYESTFKAQLRRKYQPIFFIKIEIPCLYYTIEHTVIVHTKTHGFSNYDIDLSIKIFKTHYFNNWIQLILLDDFFHHPNVLFLWQIMATNNTVNFWCSSFGRVDWIKAITACC